MSLRLPRECHAGLRGPDVLAYSRVYHRVGIRRHDPTRNFGTRMVRNTMEFQHRHHLSTDGVVGPRTFDAMRPQFDGYDKWLLRREIKKLQVTPQHLIVGYALALYAERPFPYEEVRPYPDSLGGYDRYGSDCSGTSEGCYRYAHGRFPHVPDPSGFGFNGYGSTYYQIQHGTRVYTPERGDLVFYYSAFSHVGVYLGSGRVFSHGKPGDPTIIPSSWGTMIRRYL